MEKKVNYSGWYADGLYKMAVKGQWFTIVTPKTKNVNAIPEPQPGDIVLWDWMNPKESEDFDHATVYEAPGSASPGLLAGDDTAIYASSGLKKVASLKYSGCFGTPPRSIAVIRIKP